MTCLEPSQRPLIYQIHLGYLTLADACSFCTQTEFHLFQISSSFSYWIKLVTGELPLWCSHLHSMTTRCTVQFRKVQEINATSTTFDFLFYPFLLYKFSFLQTFSQLFHNTNRITVQYLLWSHFGCNLRPLWVCVCVQDYFMYMSMLKLFSFLPRSLFCNLRDDRMCHSTQNKQ